MTLYQCTGCQTVKQADRWINASIYTGGCENGCGFVHHQRLTFLERIQYRLTGEAPSERKQKRKAGHPHTDKGYGWNGD